jgi:outer membrane receptor protein involved in Fe transport
VGLKKTVNLGTPATSSILTGSGLSANYDSTFSHATVTAGLNYQFDRHAGMFARYTYANRMPSLGNYVTSPTATPLTQTMDLGEVGAKFTSPLLDIFATGFWTKYNNVSFTNYRFDLNTGSSVTEALNANTQTFGLELESTLRPVRFFDISGTVTLQDPLQGAGLHRCFGQGEQLRRQAPDPRPHRQSAHRARLQPAA